MRFMPADETSWVVENLVADNIKTGYGKNGNTDVLYLSSYAESQGWQTNGIVSLQDKIIVSSVYKGVNGKIKVHATNYTTADRTLILVSDVETKTYTVPHNFLFADCLNKEIDEFPLNLEYEIEGDWVVAYDTNVSSENQIRAAYATVKELFTDIADTIRSKTGSSDPIARVDLPAIIDTLDVPATLTTKNIVANGTYNASADNADGFSSVTVSVPQSTLTTKSITSNGTYNASSDNADGYSSVTVNVSGLPSYMAIHEQTLTEDAATISVPYDVTRTVAMVYNYDVSNTAQGGKQATAQSSRRSFSSSSYIRSVGYTNGNGEDTATGSYGGITFDTENEVIVFALRDSSYLFKANRTYRTIIVYAETT